MASLLLIALYKALKVTILFDVKHSFITIRCKNATNLSQYQLKAKLYDSSIDID